MGCDELCLTFELHETWKCGRGCTDLLVDTFNTTLKKKGGVVVAAVDTVCRGRM